LLIKLKKTRESLFDVEYVKIKGVWSYRFTLFDSKLNKYTLRENYRNIREFLEQNTRNINKLSITTYKPIIEKLGFKHQWCLFHALKNNKIIKKYIQENELNKEEIEEIRKKL